MDRPNLFSFATSELSQDAFLCWLIAWGSPKYARSDQQLHRAGRLLVESLARAAGFDPPDDGAEVKVVRQVKGLDIVVEVGAGLVIGIEDKVDTRNHSGQLARYSEQLHGRYPGSEIALVYLKTGDQDSYDDVRRQGWAPFSRADLLAVLRESGDAVDDNIFLDFRDCLIRIENEVCSYRSLPPEDWGRRAWAGFFGALQSQLSEGNWDYVPNKSGGFMGFWWGWQPIPNGDLYLQLQNQMLTVKVAVPDKVHRREVRDHWCEVVTRQIDDPLFDRPSRLGHGQWMTVGINVDYLQMGPDGRLDIDRTVSVLQRATRAITRVAKPSIY